MPPWLVQPGLPDQLARTTYGSDPRTAALLLAELRVLRGLWWMHASHHGLD